MLTDKENEQIQKAVEATVKLAKLVKSGEIPKEDLRVIAGQCGTAEIL